MVDVAKNTTDLETGSVYQNKLVPLMNGAGIVPIGGIIAIMPHLSGAYDTAATAAAGLDGWVRCNGQVISDSQSPMNGVTVPNINNSVFLEGHTTSGTGGGANSVTLTEAQIPSHDHGMAHSHDIGHGHTHGLSVSAASITHTHSTPSHVHSSGSYNAAIAHSLGKLRLNERPNINQTPYGPAFPTWTHTTLIDISGYANTSGGEVDSTDVFGYSGSTSGGNTGSPTSTTSTVSGSVNGYTGSVSISNTTKSQNTGGGGAFNNRPAYITTVYLIRIK